MSTIGGLPTKGVVCHGECLPTRVVCLPGRPAYAKPLPPHGEDITAFAFSIHTEPQLRQP